MVQHRGNEGRKVLEAALVDEQAIQRIAHTDTAGLGIVDDGLAHLQVAVLVEIGVHYAGTRLDDRDTGSIADKVNQLAASTGDAEIDIAHGIEHLTSSLMGGWQQGNDILRHPVFL